MHNIVDVRELPNSAAVIQYYDASIDEMRRGWTVMVSIVVRRIDFLGASRAITFRPTKKGYWQTWQRMPLDSFCGITNRVRGESKQ